jgi:hypothetical protein
LPKEYNKLWVFGDSYCTTGLYVDPQDSFWGLAAKYLNVDKIINTSWSGNSWTSVQQTLIGQQQEYNWEQDYFLIGIPVLERLTVFDNYKDTRYNRQVVSKDWTVQDEPLLCHTGLQIIKGHNAQNMAIYLDRSWVETQTLNSIFLLTQWLDSKKANYVIHTLGKTFDDNNIWGPTTFNLGYCKDHPRCILFEKTYFSVNINLNKPVDFDQYGWNGHHGSAGNKHFFETSLKDKLC